MSRASLLKHETLPQEVVELLEFLWPGRKLTALQLVDRPLGKSTAPIHLLLREPILTTIGLNLAHTLHSVVFWLRRFRRRIQLRRGNYRIRYMSTRRPTGTSMRTAPHNTHGLPILSIATGAHYWSTQSPDLFS
jgi:hypothetical protein